MDDVTFGRNGLYGYAWTAEPQPTGIPLAVLRYRAESDVYECLVEN